LSGLNFYQMKTQKKYVDLGSLTVEAQFQIGLSKCEGKPKKKYGSSWNRVGAF
jgi:hypothetical protein